MSKRLYCRRCKKNEMFDSASQLEIQKQQAEIERRLDALQYTGRELGKAREEIERLTDSVNYYKTRSERSLDYTAELEDKIERLRHEIDVQCSSEYVERILKEIERMRAALERIEVRGIEIISERVGGSDASYVAQELTAIAREALRNVRGNE